MCNPASEIHGVGVTILVGWCVKKTERPLANEVSLSTYEKSRIIRNWDRKTIDTTQAVSFWLTAKAHLIYTMSRYILTVFGIWVVLYVM